MDHVAFPADLIYVDTHAHFIDLTVEAATELVLRAERAGLHKILAPAIDVRNCEAVLQVAERHATVYAGVGIHPNSVTDSDDLQRLRFHASQPKVRAIGETGLDYYRTHTEQRLQRARLEQHFDIASDRGLPIILHNRNADSDILRIATSYRGRVRGVLHCFSSTLEMAESFVDMGYFISFAGNVTYPSASSIRDVASRLPVDRILTETDSPYLAPVPFRGKRNEPAYIPYTTAVLATCMGLPLFDLLKAVEVNASALFGW